MTGYGKYAKAKLVAALTALQDAPIAIDGYDVTARFTPAGVTLLALSTLVGLRLSFGDFWLERGKVESQPGSGGGGGVPMPPRADCDHALFPKLLGIPEWIARVEDVLAVGLPAARRRTWAVEVADAAHTGAELDAIKRPFVRAILERDVRTLDAAGFDARFTDVTAAIARTRAAARAMIDALARVDDVAATVAMRDAAAARQPALDAHMTHKRNAQAGRSVDRLRPAYEAAWAAWQIATSTASLSCIAVPDDKRRAEAASRVTWSGEVDAFETAPSKAVADALALLSDAARPSAYLAFADQLVALMRGCVTL